VAAITTPFVQPSSGLFSSSGGDLAISGSGFGTTAGDIRVYLTTPTGVYLNPASHHVTQAGGVVSGTAITTVVKASSPSVSASGFGVTVAGTANDNAGSLWARVSVQGVAAPSCHVGVVNADTPVVLLRGGIKVVQSGSGVRVEISGRKFGSASGDISAVVFTPSLGSTSVVSCNDTLVVVDAADSSSAAVGDLKVVVTHSAYGSSGSVKVGVVVADAQATPVVTASTDVLESHMVSLTIGGNQFGTEATDVRVYVTPAQGTIVLAAVDTSLGTFTSTGFTVRLTGLTDLNHGELKVVVAVKGVKSSLSTVATVSAVRPVVSVGSFKVARSSGGNLVEIEGSRFHTDASAVSVVFTPALPAVHVVACVDTLLVVSVGDTSAVATGALSAVVTHSTYGSSSFGGNVATGEIITSVHYPPVIGASSLPILPMASTVQVFIDYVGSVADIRTYAADAFTKMAVTTFVPPSGMTASLPATGSARSGAFRVLITHVGVKSNVTVVGHFQTSNISLYSNDFNIARSTKGNRIELRGYGFGTDPSQVFISMSPSVGITSIHSCQDTLIVVDLADTSAIVGASLSAAVQRVTTGGTISSEEVIVAQLQSPLVNVPMLSSSTQEVSQTSTRMLVHGSNFLPMVKEMRVYLTSSCGPSVKAEVEHANSSSMVINFEAAKLNSSSITATVSLRGVLSNTATIALQGQVSRLIPITRYVESPMEGNQTIILQGRNLFSNGPISCVWSGLTTTSGAILGDGSSVSCVTPAAQANVTTSLTIVLSPSETLATEITVRFFATMLVSDLKTNSVLRFHAQTGHLVDTFVQPNSGGLDGPWGVAFGPNNQFFVASAHTAQVLAYDGSTGRYNSMFCNVPSPRGLTVHYEDLYVCSSQDATVYRFNGATGASRGIYARSPLLQHAWSIVFDRTTNRSLVASHHQHSIVEVEAPSLHADDSMFHSSQVTVWSRQQVPHVTGLDMTDNLVYALSPYGKAVMQFNRSTGFLRNRFEDSDALTTEVFDVKGYAGAVYVCGAAGIHKYIEWGPLSLLERTGLYESDQTIRCSYLYIHGENSMSQGR